ncbi:MAG: hypothetical protein QOE30_4359 [Mycobacterium sp.]|nr:hypothetical protein [Mycobacterium sp.]
MDCSFILLVNAACCCSVARMTASVGRFRILRLVTCPSGYAGHIRHSDVMFCAAVYLSLPYRHHRLKHAYNNHRRSALGYQTPSRYAVNRSHRRGLPSMS